MPITVVSELCIIDRYENDEYAIVKPNTKYGLSVYDYIVLDASTVRDDQFINQK